jgi:hypothetical protein
MLSSSRLLALTKIPGLKPHHGLEGSNQPAAHTAAIKLHAGPPRDLFQHRLGAEFAWKTDAHTGDELPPLGQLWPALHFALV